MACGECWDSGTRDKARAGEKVSNINTVSNLRPKHHAETCVAQRHKLLNFNKDMRKIIAISMPDEMHEHLRRRLSKTRYASVSEYIRQLIRNDEETGHVIAASEPLRDESSFFENLFDMRPINEILKDSVNWFRKNHYRKTRTLRQIGRIFYTRKYANAKIQIAGKPAPVGRGYGVTRKARASGNG